MSTTTLVPKEIVKVLALEIAGGVDRAVEHWMGQIDDVLSDRELTSLGRLYAIKGIVERYKDVTGKELARVPEA